MPSVGDLVNETLPEERGQHVVDGGVIVGQDDGARSRQQAAQLVRGEDVAGGDGREQPRADDHERGAVAHPIFGLFEDDGDLRKDALQSARVGSEKAAVAVVVDDVRHQRAVPAQQARQRGCGFARGEVIRHGQVVEGVDEDEVVRAGR